MLSESILQSQQCEEHQEEDAERGWKMMELSKRRAGRYLTKIGTLQPKSAATRANSEIVAVVVGLIPNATTLSTSRGGLHKRKRDHWTWFYCNDVESNVGTRCTFEVVAQFTHHRVGGTHNIHNTMISKKRRTLRGAQRCAKINAVLTQIVLPHVDKTPRTLLRNTSGQR